MSFWDEVKKPFYKKAEVDSGRLANLFNKIGFQWGEDEARHNQKNPGRAIGKAATSAALWYAGGPMWGAASGAGGTAAQVAGDAEQALASEQLAYLAAQQAAEQGATQGGTQLATSGLFSSAGDAEQGLAQQQIAQAMAQQGGKQGLSSGGLFGHSQPAFEQDFTMTSPMNPTAGEVQLPGPSRQGLFDGPDIWGNFKNATEAKAAVRDAYANGNLGGLDYAKSYAKSDLMNMDQPGEWMRRIGSNLDRASGTSKGQATNMALKALMPQQQGGGYQPAPQPSQRQGTQVPMMVSDTERARLFDDFKAGRISEEELRRKLGVTA